MNNNSKVNSLNPNSETDLNTITETEFEKNLHNVLISTGREQLDLRLKKHGCETNKDLLNTMVGGNYHLIPQMFAYVNLNKIEKRTTLINDLFRNSEFYQTKKLCVPAKALLLELIINFTEFHKQPKRPSIHLSNADKVYLVKAICPRSKSDKSQTLQRYFKNLEDAGFIDKQNVNY